MKLLLTIIIFSFAIISSPKSLYAAPKIICIGKNDQSLKIRSKKSCIKKGGTVVTKDRFDSDILCYANVDGSSQNASIRSFGGNSITNVSVERAVFAQFTITCEGSFSAISSFDDLSIHVTPASTNIGAFKNAFVRVVPLEISDSSISFAVHPWVETQTEFNDSTAISNIDFSFLVLGDL